jgi:hypothetical protein
MLQWLQISNLFTKPADYDYDGANIFWCYVPRDFVTTTSVLEACASCNLTMSPVTGVLIIEGEGLMRLALMGR